MAAKKEETTKTEAMEIGGIKVKTLTLELVGDSPLILNKKTRSFEREEIYKQSNPKGEKIPDELNQKLNYNLWEKLITSITWEKPVPVHDDYKLYTEEEYNDAMLNNRPCIKAKAFIGSITEAFISLGYKEATGRTGADLRRCLSIATPIIPVDITTYHYDVHLTPNNTIAHTNVLAQYTEFMGWSCELTISFVDSVFPQKTMIELINSAGTFIGIGTRRGESFGKYHVAKVTLCK